MAEPAPRSTPRFGLIGTFDVENYGDCLFAHVYAHLLRGHFPEAEIKLYSPFARAAEILDFAPVHALPATLGERPIAADALIQTGGETLAVGHSSGTYLLPDKTLSHYLRMWLAPTVWNGRGAARFFAHGVGVPPTLAQGLGPTARVLHSAERVRARDAVSAQHLGCEVAVDPVFLLADVLAADQWQERARRALPAGARPGDYIVCHISPPYAEGQDAVWLEQVIALLRRTGGTALLLPVCHFLGDHAYLQLAAKAIARRAPDLAGRVIAPEANLRPVLDTAAIIAASAGVVTSSLHAAVTAAAFGLPLAVYPGRGGAHGKHSQTLLAAGVTDGIALTIGDLDNTFAASQASDRLAQTSIARQRAKEGFDALCAAISGDARTTGPVAEADLAELIRLDRVAMTPAASARRALRRIAHRFPHLRAARLRHSFARRLAV
ncbi:polysaccharide pyruvyl transferase family protein [Erythrobacter sp. EC-HK427]|uniref:polysaccharide pyruvyl transferase family protein n=1 Tax=Erythrobacter sp. EC-HK427 TaxID=2038396 RepID=UPI001259E712|nr:polysaccharide pyruvyl transferase family protein [Erythrobacter sp. EC-HK427]VVT02305.1 conserved hypothetical protein [Erythrobacter sp. EC-HK427]